MSLVTPSAPASNALPGPLCTLADGIQQALDRACRQTAGIRLADWRVLAALDVHGPVSAGTVAERAGLERPRVTRAVARLRERGLVTRQPHPDDRRVVHLALTEAGTACLKRLGEIENARPDRLLAHLSHTERETIGLLLDGLRDKTVPAR
ncbi:hypothetical protein KBTX_00061 [wastewater metagenome]|uniref:HTH marR-type domain-containing protein n=2 Tax=unclassified sequences TaxID=12908 RepID=A0A5B8R5L5_9ZZZZ|nr:MULTISPECIES: MarR family transcriptional regulator [Arhodomonas]MCS4502756.1 MarR family transcriptional regulator [Arhodomonas aquaeolei]QEA03761.1 hypothetical protein KBTEX_00061 [uncultured organism]